MTTDLRERLHDNLKGARIVSFSIDPELDTPEELERYRASRDIDPERWLFLTGENAEAVRDFVRDGLKVPVVQNEDAPEHGLSITHGTRMPVIDPEGRIAGWYELAAETIAGEADPAAGDEESIAARYRLVEARLKAIAGRPYPRPTSGSPLPLVNACLNFTATMLLLLGLAAIKGDRRERHELFMKLAFLVSAAFLASYLYYHGVVQRKYGPTPFNGTGGVRAAYLTLLASHVLLAIVNLPMVLRTFWLAHKERWDAHKRLARWTFPIWLYVSVTGVLVYVVLYHLNPVP